MIEVYMVCISYKKGRYHIFVSKTHKKNNLVYLKEKKYLITFLYYIPLISIFIVNFYIKNFIFF